MGSALSLEQQNGGFGNPDVGFGRGNPVPTMSRLGGTNAVAQLAADTALQSAKQVLSTSRLVDTNVVAQLVAEIPLQLAEGEAGECGSKRLVWEKRSTDGTESQVVRHAEDDIGVTIQFLQSQAPITLPISIIVAIHHRHHCHPEAPPVKLEPHAPL